MLFQLTLTSSGPSLWGKHRLDQSTQKVSKTSVPSSQRAPARAWKGSQWDLSGTANCTTSDQRQDNFTTRTFEKQSGWGRGGAAGVQPRHSCPGDRGRGPSGSRTLPSTGQGLTLIKFHHLDRSHTLPLTDLSSLTTKPGTNVKKVQNRLWTIKTLAKTKNLNKPN